MYVQLIQLPLDAGHWGARRGRGPGALVAAGAAERLRDHGHAVEEESVGWRDAFPTEVASAFEAAARLRSRVRAALWRRRFPLVLSGNCLAAAGALAALPSDSTGLVWIDAHADLHTPGTTTTGDVDRMALSIAAGRCWRSLAAHRLGGRAVDPSRILLLGSREVDAEERAVLVSSGIPALPARPDDALHLAMDRLAERVESVHLHIDLSVLDPSIARGSPDSPPGEPSLDALLGAIELIGGRLPLRAATVSGYDPALDLRGVVADAALRILETIVRRD